MKHSEILATMRSLPDELERLVQGLSGDELGWRPSPQDWSIIEIGCHLRDDGEISTLRIQRLATEDGPTIEPYNEEELASTRNYRGDEMHRVLPAVRSAWTGLAGTLERLPPDAWQRVGHHPERGRVTIASEALQYAEHARQHVGQINAILERLPAQP